MMVGNILWVAVLLGVATLASSKSKFYKLSKESVTSFENTPSNSQESNKHIAFRLLSQIYTRPPYNVKKKKPYQIPKPHFDYDAYNRDQVNRHFCVGNKCYNYVADEGKIYEIKPDADSENVNVHVNYFEEDKNVVKGQNVDDGYERDNEDETSDKNTKTENKDSAKDDKDATSDQITVDIENKVPAQYINMDDMDKISNQLRNKDINTKTQVSEDYVGDLFKDDIGKVFTKENIYEQRLLNKDRNVMKENNSDDVYENNDEIDNHYLSKLTNMLRNQDNYAKTPFSADYVGDLFSMRATGNGIKNNNGTKKNFNAQTLQLQTEETKDLKSRKRGMKMSAYRKKQQTTTPSNLESFYQDSPEQENRPRVASVESKSNEFGFKKRDEPESNESGSKRSDESRSNESGSKKSDESNENRLRMADAFNSIEFGSKKADESKSNESKFKKADTSATSASQSREMQNTKWNRFKIVKHKKKPVDKPNNLMSQENDRFDKASTETLESLSEEPKPKPVQKKKRRPRIPGRPEHYMQGGARLITEGEDFRKKKEDVNLRRRLPHFMPKRYHWDEKDFQRLGYFWFNGPQGRIPPGPWRISY